MDTLDRNESVRLAIPKGRMHDEIARLLDEAGLKLTRSARDYRPTIGLAGWDVKVLKPQAVIEMLAAGARDAGFAGADWVREQDADLVEVLDTGLDPVRLVAAAPGSLLGDRGELPGRNITIASEYVRTARAWAAERGLDARVLRSWGATEVLPPEDADLIIDNTATGATLEANGLRIIDTLGTSTTRLFAARYAMETPARRDAIENFASLLRAVLEARRRVLIELNVTADALERVVEVLPCMREPTISPLHGGAGYALKAAAPRDSLARVIPILRSRGATDIVVTKPVQIME